MRSLWADRMTTVARPRTSRRTAPSSSSSMSFHEGRGTTTPFFEDTSTGRSASTCPGRPFSELEGLAELPPLGTLAVRHLCIERAISACRCGHGGQLRIAALANAAKASWPPTRRSWRASGASRGSASIDPDPAARAHRRGAVRLHVRHPARHARDHARRPALPGQTPGRRGECPKVQLEFAIDYTNTTGLKTVFIPLHRGSDGVHVETSSNASTCRS